MANSDYLFMLGTQVFIINTPVFGLAHAIKQTENRSNIDLVVVLIKRCSPLSSLSLSPPVNIVFFYKPSKPPAIKNI